MLQVEVSCPAALAGPALELLQEHPAVSALSVGRGASVKPVGDVITAYVPREAANDVLEELRTLGIHREGAIRVTPVDAWISQPGYDAELAAPGAGADAVVWPEVVQRAYADTELTWAFVSFMVLATFIAAVAIVLDSVVLVIAAMVLGPEFGAVAALGLALVRKRPGLLGRAGRTLAAGFAVAILATTVFAVAGNYVGWIEPADLLGARPGTAFVYSPDRWSFIVAIIAGAAGVLSITSSKSGGLVGVFISVTTIPAAGNAALALGLGVWSELWGSLLQLVVNIIGMAVAGWLTLVLQQTVWQRVRILRRRRARTDDPRI
ncbi:MAG: DUF389 domain-containing protein [Actinobacteria bacterium]|nr:DUF389 domain-containing protein [Actinomycetota bacterium]